MTASSFSCAKPLISLYYRKIVSTATNSGAALPSVSAPADPAVALALEVGWTVALLYGEVDLPHGYGRPGSTHYAERLPTEHELDPVDRVQLEHERLGSLVNQMKSLKRTPAIRPPAVPRMSLAKNGNATQLRERLQIFHFAMLKCLASAGRDLGLAYQLGRSLRDTANPPLRLDPPPPGEEYEAYDPEGQLTNDLHIVALTAQLKSARVAKLQNWLATLGSSLPKDSASIVSASMEKWSDLVGVIFRSVPQWQRALPPRESTNGDAALLREALLFQGDAWLDLLIGAESSSGLLTSESYVAAGEAALSRTVRLIRRVLAHYWVALVLLVVALGAIVFIASRELGGAPRVVTQIVAVAGAFGITAKGIANSVVTLGTKMETPIYSSAELDAKAWAITTFPVDLALNGGELWALRRCASGRLSVYTRLMQN